MARIHPPASGLPIATELDLARWRSAAMVARGKRPSRATMLLQSARSERVRHVLRVPVRKPGAVGRLLQVPPMMPGTGAMFSLTPHASCVPLLTYQKVMTPALVIRDIDMPRQKFSALRNALTEALNSGLRRQTHEEWLLSFQDEFYANVWNRGLVLENSDFQQLCGVIAGYPEIKSVDGLILYAGQPGASETIGIESISWWLLDRSLVAGPAVAVADLLKFLKTRRASILWVTLLYGIAVQGPVKLGEGFQLLPFKALPNSRQKRAFERRHQGAGFLPDLGHEPAALTLTEVPSKILVPKDFQPSPDRQHRQKIDWSTPATRMDARDCYSCAYGKGSTFGLGFMGASRWTWSAGCRSTLVHLVAGHSAL